MKRHVYVLIGFAVSFFLLGMLSMKVETSFSSNYNMVLVISVPPEGDGFPGLGFLILNWTLGVLCLVGCVAYMKMERLKEEVVDHRGILVMMRLRK